MPTLRLHNLSLNLWVQSGHHLKVHLYVQLPVYASCQAEKIQKSEKKSEVNQWVKP